MKTYLNIPEAALCRDMLLPLSASDSFTNRSHRSQPLAVMTIDGKIICSSRDLVLHRSHPGTEPDHIVSSYTNFLIPCNINSVSDSYVRGLWSIKMLRLYTHGVALQKQMIITTLM